MLTSHPCLWESLIFKIIPACILAAFLSRIFSDMPKQVPGNTLIICCGCISTGHIQNWSGGIARHHLQPEKRSKGIQDLWSYKSMSRGCIHPRESGCHLIWVRVIHEKKSPLGHNAMFKGASLESKSRMWLYKEYNFIEVMGRCSSIPLLDWRKKVH